MARLKRVHQPCSRSCRSADPAGRGCIAASGGPVPAFRPRTAGTGRAWTVSWGTKARTRSSSSVPNLPAVWRRGDVRGGPRRGLGGTGALDSAHWTLDTARCSLDAAPWTLRVRPRHSASLLVPCCLWPASWGQRRCRQLPRALAPGETSTHRAQQGRPRERLVCLICAPAPSHGHLVPPPQRCHGVSSADPLVEGRAPLGVPLPCPRVVRPWPSFQGVTRWSGLVALCLRCRSVVCLAGGQRGQPRVAWMTGGGALLPLVTESVLAVH